MEPTRWTRRHRLTKYGKGGWRIYRYGVGYISPLTGDGVFCDWRNLPKLLKIRRDQRSRRATRAC
jgi:hypothetical protein